MPIITQILCDSCQAVKKETNHWYTLVDGDDGLCLRPMAYTPPALMQLGASHVSYFCGRRCAMDGIGHWMDRLTFDASAILDARQSGMCSRPVMLRKSA